MKAKDYVDKFYSKIEAAYTSKNCDDQLLLEIVVAFTDEAAEIMKSRGVKTLEAQLSIFKELNQKYNKFCRLINTKLGGEFLKENGLRSYWIIKCPLLEGMI